MVFGAGIEAMSQLQDELIDWSGVHYCTDEGEPATVAIADYAPTCPHCGVTFKALWWVDNPETKPRIKPADPGGKDR
jgi:hypothetical protein